MDYSMLITSILFAFLAIALGVGVFKGYRQPWQKTVTRIAAVFLAFLTAIGVAKEIAKSVASFAFEMVKSNVSAEMFAEITKSLPSLEKIVGALCCIVLAPIIYVIPLILFRIIYAIIGHFVVKAIIGENDLLDEDEDEEAAEEEAAPAAAVEANEDDDSEEIVSTGSIGEKILGMALGALCGLLIFVVSWAPLTGAIGLIGDLSDTLKTQTQDIAELEEIYEIIDPITDSAAVKFTNAMGGEAIFNSLTTARANGVKIQLRTEIDCIIAIVKNIDVFTDGDEFTDEKIITIANIVTDIFDNSTILPMLASEFITGAANAWSNGEAFCGVTLPIDFENAELKGFILDTIAGFKDSSVDTVRQDVHTIVNIAVILVENDVLDTLEEGDAMELLKDTKVMRPLLIEIFKNPHTAAIVDNTLDFAIHFFASSVLNANDNLDDLYVTLVGDLAEIKASENEKDITNDIKAAFSKVGISLTKESAEALKDKFIATFGEDLSKISVDGVKSLLSGNDITITLSDKTTTTLKIKDNASIVKHTVLITVDALKSTHSGITNIEKEVDTLVKTIASLPELADAMNGDNQDLGVFMQNIGGILDDISASQLIGRDCTNNLIILIFQSDLISDVLPIDTVSITNAAKTIINGAANKSYKVVMAELGKTVDALMSFTDSNNADIKDTETLNNLLTTITPESAEIIENMISEELVSDLGIDEESASAMTNILSSTLNKIAVTEGDKKSEEVEKITNVISTTIDMTTNGGENVDITMTDYVGDILDSSVLTETIVEHTYDENGELKDNALNTNYTYVPADDEEKAELEATLTEKLAASENKEDTEKAIQAIGSMINVQFVIVDGVVTLVPNP